MMNLQGQKWAVYGIQGSGKTFHAKQLMRGFRRPFVYAIHPDDFKSKSEKCYVYVPENKMSAAEFDAVCGKVRELAKKGKIDLFLVDEADMYLRTTVEHTPNLNDLVLNHRHYDLSLAFISRRPQDIPAKIVESCHLIDIFPLEGDNVIDKLGRIHPDIPAVLAQCQYRRYDYVRKIIGQPPVHMNP